MKFFQLGWCFGIVVRIDASGIVTRIGALRLQTCLLFNHRFDAGNDICKEAKRQIISADDVLAALEDIEFAEFLPVLKDSLEGELYLVFEYAAFESRHDLTFKQPALRLFVSTPSATEERMNSSTPFIRHRLINDFSTVSNQAFSRQESNLHGIRF